MGARESPSNSYGLWRTCHLRYRLFLMLRRSDGSGQPYGPKQGVDFSWIRQLHPMTCIHCNVLVVISSTTPATQWTCLCLFAHTVKLLRQQAYARTRNLSHEAFPSRPPFFDRAYDNPMTSTPDLVGLFGAGLRSTSTLFRLLSPQRSRRHCPTSHERVQEAFAEPPLWNNPT